MDSFLQVGSHFKKFIYIAGVGRSGSTKVESLFVERGYTSLGELNAVWQFGMKEDAICSCGDRFSVCEFWSDYRSIAPNPNEVSLMPEKLAFFPFFYLVDKFSFRCRKLDKYLAHNKQLYMSLLRRDKSYIESSKNPFRLYWLRKHVLDGVQVIHLVRHPSDVINSWANPKFNPGRGMLMQRKGTLRASLEWLLRNWFCLHVLKQDSVRMRIEDFDGDLRCFGIAFDESEPSQPFHSISGNPGRFENNGELVNRKLVNVSIYGSAVCRAICGKLALKFGYKKW